MPIETFEIMQMDDLPQMRNKFGIKAPNAKTSKWFIFASILIHVLILLVIVLAKQKPSTPESFSTEAPLKSYLYTLPKTQKPIVTPQLTSDTTQSNENKLMPSPAAENDLSTDEPIQAPKKEITQAVSEDQQAKQALEILQNTSSKTSKENSSLSKSILSKSRIDKAVQNYQSSIDSKAINNMALEEAREYELRKTSPLLNIPDLPSAEERAATLRTREIDCNNKAKLVVAALAGAFNGNVRCRQSNQFQEYIDKRLNKEAKDERKR
jgi:hypothetical protein